MLFLIVYDISINSVRTKIARILITEGFERLQLSVFLGLTNPKANTVVWATINKLIQEDAMAKMYILPIPKSSLKNIKQLGIEKLDIAYLLGDKNSYFI